MIIADIIADPSRTWTKAAPAKEEFLATLSAGAPAGLPKDYLTFLRLCNGGEGELGRGPGWFQIWPAEDVLTYNQNYEIAENAPGFLGFGSSGGGELLAFDMRGGARWHVVMIPFVGMEPESARVIARDFLGFAQAIGKAEKTATPLYTDKEAREWLAQQIARKKP